ncbi:hypothetical protein EV426DRAFT_356329 [Tirmania nivea]|nr:hypothetical protein EV426DRAFT_356329 [Tirmania nivea]
MTSAIPKDVNWVEDVCSSNLGTVARINNTLYGIAGFLILRDSSDPNSPGVTLANSHLYTIDLSGNSIDLEKDYASIITVQRLPDDVPRTMWGNMFSDGKNQLQFFGGLQNPYPIYLANGTWDLGPRPEINDGMWTYQVKEGKWVDVDSSGKRLTSGLGKDVLGQAAKAQSYNPPAGEGVQGWLYGGAVWEEQYKIGNTTVGNATSFQELRDLLEGVDGSTASNGVYSLAKVNTTTATSVTAPRPAVQGGMVFLPSLGDEGALVLVGGSSLGADTSMKQVNVYDIATKTWFTQATSAVNNTFPEDRTEGCIVAGAARDGSSMNIYLYGGKLRKPPGSDPPFVSLGEVWVLSMPTFEWIRSGKDEAVTRVGHTCHVVNERYLVSYRGLGPTPCDKNGGVQVYDMNSMQWTTKMVSGTGYEVPETVYHVIGGSTLGGATKVTPTGGFVDSRLQQLFKYSPRSSTTATATSSSKSSNNAVKIAVPIVVIFLLLSALLAGCYLYKRRRWRIYEARASATAAELPHRENNKPMEYYVGELPGPQKVMELDSNYPPAYELDSPGNKRDSDVNPGPVMRMAGARAAGNGGVTSAGIEERQGQEMNNDNNRGYGHGAVGIREVRDSERGGIMYNA